MCAGHTSDLQIIKHIQENPAKAKKGIEIITESLMIFVKECIKLGVDGFYHSTQGGESHTFNDSALFNECIKPFDLILMEEINKSCDFNILHVCDYHDGYDDLTPFLDYPGHIVNCSLELGTGKLTAQEVSQMFDRPFMGGLDRLGTIASGSQDEIKKAVAAECSHKSTKFLLGADCTVPSDIDWDNLKTAITAAHGFEIE
jgi:uroporphyrinogen decarboxylase